MDRSSNLFSGTALPAKFYRKPRHLFLLSVSSLSAQAASSLLSRPPPGTSGTFRDVAFSGLDRKSTRLNSSHVAISYAVFCLKKKKIPWADGVPVQTSITQQ